MQHRKGKEGDKITRTLFNSDGLLGRWEAYRMIDEAEEGSRFFRLVISPDPAREDTQRDLSLREMTEQTMLCLEDRMQTSVAWVATIHQDHAPHRHVHIVAAVPGRLLRADFQAMRQTATAACLAERHERDLAISKQVVLPLNMVENSNSLCKSLLGWFICQEAVRTGHLILE